MADGSGRDQTFRLRFPYFRNLSAALQPPPPAQRQQSLPPPQRPSAPSPSQPPAKSEPRPTTQQPPSPSSPDAQPQPTTQGTSTPSSSSSSSPPPSQATTRPQPRSTTRPTSNPPPRSRPPPLSSSPSPSPSRATTRSRPRPTTQPTSMPPQPSQPSPTAQPATQPQLTRAISRTPSPSLTLPPPTLPSSPRRTPPSKSPERPQPSKPPSLITTPTTTPSPPPSQSASPPQQSDQLTSQTTPTATVSQSYESKQETLDPLLGVKPTQTPISEKEEAKPTQIPQIEEKLPVDTEPKQSPQMIKLKGEGKHEYEITRTLIIDQGPNEEANPNQFRQIEEKAPDNTKAKQSPQPTNLEAEEKRETDIEPKQSIQPTQVPQVKEKLKETIEESKNPVPEGDSKEIETPKTIKETEEKEKPIGTFSAKMKAKSPLVNPNSDLSIILEDEIKQNAEENDSWPRGKESDTGASKTAHASASRGGKSIQREVREGISKLFQKLNMEHGVSIITLEGKNNGATMFVDDKRANREGNFPMQRGYKLNEKQDEATNERKASKETESITNINSNVQSINNSIQHESSCSARDPGVHFVFTSKAT